MTSPTSMPPPEAFFQTCRPFQSSLAPATAVAPETSMRRRQENGRGTGTPTLPTRTLNSRCRERRIRARRLPCQCTTWSTTCTLEGVFKAFLANSELLKLSPRAVSACRSRSWRGTLEASPREACGFRQVGVGNARVRSAGERFGLVATAAADKYSSYPSILRRW